LGGKKGRSRFDSDSLQARKITGRIESDHVTHNFYPSDSIGLDVPEPSREQLHQLFISRAYALGFPVVWVAGGSVAREKLIQRTNLHP